MQITVICHWEKGWWAEIPQLPHCYTQARRLDKLDGMVRQAAAFYTGQSPDSFTVEMQYMLGDEADDEAVSELKLLRRQMKDAQRTASVATEATARRLVARGLTMRDIGQMIGVSHQRVQRLVNG